MLSTWTLYILWRVGSIPFIFRNKTSRCAPNCTLNMLTTKWLRFSQTLPCLPGFLVVASGSKIFMTYEEVQCLSLRFTVHRSLPCYIRLFVCFWRDSPQWARASSFTRFLDNTQRRATVGRTPLDVWSARRRDLYLATHTTLTTDKCPCPRWDSNP
jgi:hypothetical protein